MQYYGSESTATSEAKGEYYLNDLLQSYYTKDVNSKGNSHFVGSNIFYKYYDKEKNKILDSNAGINYESRDNNSIHSTILSTPAYEGIRTLSDDQNREYYLKLDYSQPVGKAGDQLEFGGKTSFRNNVMPYEYFNDINNNWITDATRSNTFHYFENLSSAYANFSKTFLKNLKPASD